MFEVTSEGSFVVNKNPDTEAPYLPLIISLNCRSIYNKVKSFSDMLKELRPDALAAVETFEQENRL